MVDCHTAIHTSLCLECSWACDWIQVKKKCVCSWYMVEEHLFLLNTASVYVLYVWLVVRMEVAMWSGLGQPVQFILAKVEEEKKPTKNPLTFQWIFQLCIISTDGKVHLFKADSVYLTFSRPHWSKGWEQRMEGNNFSKNALKLGWNGI